MRFLKNQPFAVEAFFDRSLVLTFAVPKEQLQSFIPERLTLDTFQDRWAFIAVAMVHTSKLRPKGLPKFLGSNFFLIGYRIFVRYTHDNGKRLRGLYILQSETDKKKMEFFGNLFTHYKYTTTDIEDSIRGDLRTIKSTKSAFHVTVNQADNDVRIPRDSPFSDWKDARKFAGPLPHTFSYHRPNKTVLIIEGVRQHWKPKPVTVEKYHFAFLNDLELQDAVLASAFEVQNIPYHWKKGRIEKRK